ncbi:MAG: ROK family protein [Bacteroidales bacterium]|nr:ROK family protein [Bacteroidales bacterium]
MALLGIDLGGSKVAFALFDHEGNMRENETLTLDNRRGTEVGNMIAVTAALMLAKSARQGDAVQAVGISVPGISRREKGTVWAPNIPGWDDYPLLKEIRTITEDIPVTIESDRACYISGEIWKGNARGCTDAIFLAVGTGIGAGIFVSGNIMHGSHDIAGAIGWMALERPFRSNFTICGNFEYYASGEGITRQAEEYLHSHIDYKGELATAREGKITTRDVFSAWKKGDAAATEIIRRAVEYWGMASANLVSLFNPEKIIFGGGVFGPAVELIPAIRLEAEKWAQPISMKQASFEPSALAGDAGVFGAGFIAMKYLEERKDNR